MHGQLMDAILVPPSRLNVRRGAVVALDIGYDAPDKGVRDQFGVIL